MSFRDNLQHLRATRNMTQEQLAVLLGVSRQSVTKWESERSYPEMDKLLKMCDLFGCTLDELVQGDLTGRPAEPAATEPVYAPPQDVYGYDEHMRKFTLVIATGVAAVILGVAATVLIDWLLTTFGASGVSSTSDGLAAIALFVGAGIGLVCFIPAGIEHGAFTRAHPHIPDFYTESEKASARRTCSWCITLGIIVIFIGVMVPVVLDGTAYGEGFAAALLLALIAAGVWLIIFGGMTLSRTNLAQRNRDAVSELEVEDIMNAQVDDAVKQEMLEARKNKSRIGDVCGIIMILATIVGLVLLFVQGSELFWLAWPIGGMLCGVASILMSAFSRAN